MLPGLPEREHNEVVQPSTSRRDEDDSQFGEPSASTRISSLPYRIDQNNHSSAKRLKAAADFANSNSHRTVTPPPERRAVGQTMNLSPYALHPDAMVRLHLEGNLDDVARYWLDKELRMDRKIVVFKRQSRGRDITASFKVVTEANWDNDPGSMNCIWWSARQEAYATLTDTILLLEWMLATVFTAPDRIRTIRNLEGFRPELISEDNPETRDFFSTITNLPSPMPRTIHDSIEVFPWQLLPVVLNKILSKYSVRFPNRLDPAPARPMSHEIGPATDSGYASWCPSGPHNLLVPDGSTTLQVNDPNRPQDHERDTTYSDNTSIDTTSRAGFIEQFAYMLLRDVSHGVSEDAFPDTTFSKGIDELLADFAVRLGYGSAIIELRQSMMFIHKYKSSISNILRRKSHDASDTESDEGQRDSEKLAVSEIMQMWYERGYDQDQDPVPENSETTNSMFEEVLEPLEHDIQRYERFIAASPAYKWLVESLQGRSLLTTTNQDVIDRMRAEICKHVPKTTHFSGSNDAGLSEVLFVLSSDFAVNLGLPGNDYLDSTLSVTGSQQDAQALTCAQYIQQTWPTNGMAVWRLVKDSLHHPGKRVSDDSIAHVNMWAQVLEDKLTISMTGTRGVLVEAAEQMCWISAAISSPSTAIDMSSNTITLCSPYLDFIACLRAPHEKHETDEGTARSNLGSMPDYDSTIVNVMFTCMECCTEIASIVRAGGSKHVIEPANQQSSDCVNLVQVAIEEIGTVRRQFEKTGSYLQSDRRMQVGEIMVDTERAIYRVAKLLKPARVRSANEPGPISLKRDPWVLQDGLKSAAIFGQLQVILNQLKIVLIIPKLIEVTKLGNSNSAKLATLLSYLEDFRSQNGYDPGKSSRSQAACVRCLQENLQCDKSQPSCKECLTVGLSCHLDASHRMLIHPGTAPAKQEQNDVSFGNGRITAIFKIGLKYQICAASPQTGMCWQSLFKRCVIIHGFPIRRRLKDKLGLELSLELMSELIGIQYLHRFSERLFFKQYSMMLTPAAIDGKLLIWHLCKSQGNERISYFDNGLPDMRAISYDDLADCRHIVGWCSSVKHVAGHMSGSCDIETADLEPSPQSGSLFNCSLSFGRPVSGKITVRYIQNQRTLAAQRNYIEMFRFLERRFILLWDTDASRGWLMNGLRVTLHILRQSFKLDKDEDLGGLFVLKPSDFIEPLSPHSARAARESLTNPKNLSAKLSISNMGATECEYETLSDRFERMYDVLEQEFDYQSKPRNWEQVPRRYLEGWDFLAIARKDDIVPAYVYNLPSIGRSWVDFTRTISAVTLMATGFGELLKGRTPMCESVPKGIFCLAVSIADLSEAIKMKSRSKDGKSKPRYLSPSIIWHSPQGSSQTWDCTAKEEGSSGTIRQPLQVMWPAEHRSMLPCEDDQFTLEGRSNGAVIFGHDESLQYYLPDLGCIPLRGRPPETSKELEITDSGIGSSLDSMHGLGRTHSRSTLSPFDDPQSVSRHPSSQRNSYGDSVMSGGYGVFGNVSGNLTVTQYFGAATTDPSHCPPSSVSLEPSLSSQQGKRADLQLSSTNSRSPALASREDEVSLIDVELEQGQMEIKALGLEGYCDVFRWS